MPRKPQILHPVRQVRTCLGYTQPDFAKLVGCSAVAIQRVENGSLPLSAKLANAIMEATGANPRSLRAGHNAKAIDMLGHEYTKKSFEFYKNVLPCTDKELQFLLHKLINNLELLLITANQGKFKTYA